MISGIQLLQPEIPTLSARRSCRPPRWCRHMSRRGRPSQRFGVMKPNLGVVASLERSLARCPVKVSGELAQPLNQAGRSPGHRSKRHDGGVTFRRVVDDGVEVHEGVVAVGVPVGGPRPRRRPSVPPTVEGATVLSRRVGQPFPRLRVGSLLIHQRFSRQYRG